MLLVLKRRGKREEHAWTMASHLMMVVTYTAYPMSLDCSIEVQTIYTPKLPGKFCLNDRIDRFLGSVGAMISRLLYTDRFIFVFGVLLAMSHVGVVSRTFPCQILRLVL